MFLISSILLGLLMLYFALYSNVRDPLHTYLGLVIVFLSLAPAVVWLKHGGSRFPVFEPIMALCATAYAFPLLAGHQSTLYYPPETLTLAALAVIAYQVTAIFCYRVTGGRPGRSRFWSESVLTKQLESWVIYGITISTVYMAVASFTTWIPVEIGSILRAVFFGVSILCVFVTTQRWGHGELSANHKVLFTVMFALQLIFLCTSLLLVRAICQLGIALLGYLSSGRRVPWVLMAAIFVTFAILHNGKEPMRQLYWREDKPPPTLTGLPSFYREWIGFGMQQHIERGRETTSVNRQLLERTSLFHILCLVVRQSPEYQPHLSGETYKYVLPQLIPRFFWPEKPPSHIGTYRLSTYYGLQDESATETTTIAFGMVTEAYANFGFVGVIGLGACIGFFLKKAQVWTLNSPLFSPGGLLMIILTAWSFNSEMTLAVWVSSLFQALVVVIGIPVALRSVLGD